MRTIGAGLLLAVLTLGAQAAEMSGARTGEIITQLEADPQTDELLIEVDTYGPVVVLHGWTVSARQRDRVVEKVRAMPNVEVVFNYITSDADRPDLATVMNQSERLRVEQGNMQDTVYDLGVMYDLSELKTVGADVTLTGAPVPLPDYLGLRVKERLDIGDFTRFYNLRVDNYEGLVILHGNVPTWRVKREAESIAAHTPGVKHVFSYLNVAEPLVAENVIYGEPAPAYPFTVALRHDDTLLRRGRIDRPRYVRYEREVEEEPLNVTYRKRICR